MYFGLNGTIINVYVSIIYFLIHLSSHSTCKRDNNKEKEYIFMEKNGINFRISLPAIFSYMLYIIIIRSEIGFVTKNISTKHKKEAVDEI